MSEKEINKLTESNIDIIYDKINIIVINKNTTKIPDDKLKYIFDNIIIKCINQPIFSSLYIKFLNKFNRNVNSKPFIRKEIETIIKHIVEFIDLIEIQDDTIEWGDRMSSTKEIVKHVLDGSNEITKEPNPKNNRITQISVSADGKYIAVIADEYKLDIKEFNDRKVDKGRIRLHLYSLIHKKYLTCIALYFQKSTGQV